MAHTPAPWHLSKSGLYVRKTPPGIDSMDWNICTMNEQSENYENDARLIAAAPELLEALKACVKVYEENRDAQPTGHLWPDPNHIFHARRVIARAEGSQPKEIKMPADYGAND